MHFPCRDAIASQAQIKLSHRGFHSRGREIEQLVVQNDRHTAENRDGLLEYLLQHFSHANHMCWVARNQAPAVAAVWGKYLVLEAAGFDCPHLQLKRYSDGLDG